MPLAGRRRLAEQSRDVAEQDDELLPRLGITRGPGASQLDVQGRELVLQFCSHCCHASTADEAAILCENASAVRSVVFLSVGRGLRGTGGGGGVLLLARQPHVILL